MTCKPCFQVQTPTDTVVSLTCCRALYLVLFNLNKPLKIMRDHCWALWVFITVRSISIWSPCHFASSLTQSWSTIFSIETERLWETESKKNNPEITLYDFWTIYLWTNTCWPHCSTIHLLQFKTLQWNYSPSANYLLVFYLHLMWSDSRAVCFSFSKIPHSEHGV